MIEDNDSKIVEQMMNNYEKDSTDSTVTQSTGNTSSAGPETDSYSDLGGKTDSRSRKERRVLSYAREFVAEGYNGNHLPVELEDLTFRVSSRMSRASGRYTPSKEEVLISGQLIDNSTWDEVKETIRHELVHAWQHQTLEWPRKGISGSKWQWHGSSFKQWIPKLDISVRADAPAKQEYTYDIHCPNCGHLGGRQRKCKSIKQIVSGSHNRYCKGCKSNDLFVKKDGQKIESVYRL